MNSELSRVLKREFHTKMQTSLPAFQKTDSEFGGVVYRKHDPDSDRYIFVFLEPNPKTDRFTLELAAATVPNFPFKLLPGEQDSPSECRYRIRTFLDRKFDGWWNVNMPDSPLPDLNAIMKTFEPEAIQKGLAKLPGLVEDAFDQLKVALPRFIAAIEKGREKA